MMKFTCRECSRRFCTTDDPVPGRVYRIRCRCGSTIVVQRDERAEAMPPPPAWTRGTPTEPLLLQAASEDPFFRAAMDAAFQEDVAATAVAPVCSPRLARRDPEYAARDEASEPSIPQPCEAGLPETTREMRLAATRALLLDAIGGVREALGAGVRQLVRSWRLVAGGALLGAVAFALGAWVGAASTASRWKAKAVAAAALAEARPGTFEAPPAEVASLGPVAMPAGDPAPAAMARGVAPSGATPASRGEPALRRDASHAGPAAVRRAEKPAVRGGPTAVAVSAAEEPRPAQDPPPGKVPEPAADRMPKGHQAMTATPSEGRDVEAASDATLTASLNPPPDTDAATSPMPPAAEPAHEEPGK